MKSNQSNFNLRSPGSYLAHSYLIATVRKGLIQTHSFSKLLRTEHVSQILILHDVF